MDPERRQFPPPARAWSALTALVVAYIGIYLCRKNLAVAVPILQDEWSLSKEAIGLVASVSTVAYALGKVVFGPVVDKVGGRRALLIAMFLVALFGGAGAAVPGLTALMVVYSANRLAGSAGWGAMVKLVPDWFPRARWSLALAVLSLSFVFGGALAVGFAGLIARWTDDNWRMILALPAGVLFVLAVVIWKGLPKSETGGMGGTRDLGQARSFSWRQIPGLWRLRQLHVICGLSFTLTFLRETFNFWTVDYLKTEGGVGLSTSAAAFLSTPFDVMGSLGILAVGAVYGRISETARRWLLFVLLTMLSALLLWLPYAAGYGVAAVATVIGLVGFLVYGPYSLLAGVLAVEVRGANFAATVTGLVDAAGYLAGILSGFFFGRLIQLGGYNLGFQLLAGLTLGAAVLALLLYPRPRLVLVAAHSS